ncbi:MAG: HipA N-terminal domain-containing protein [Clostridia bacterium]
MKERRVLVYLRQRLVGTLAVTADHRVAFAYSEEWLADGYAISPFSLPVEQKVFVPLGTAFRGLWGVFADSLPDAWGGCWSAECSKAAAYRLAIYLLLKGLRL